MRERGSSVSRPHSFDTAGVEQPQHALPERSSHVLPAHNQEGERPSSFASSAITLTGLNVADGFDLEKTTRHIVRR